MELSEYVLATVRRDEELLLYRGEHRSDTEAPSVLLIAPVSARPALETIKKLEHEYSLSAELDSAWAVRPLALAQHSGQLSLVLEDPGGETLDRLLRGPMEMTQFLRIASGLATALSRLHKSGLIHKDIKPTNVHVSSATGRRSLGRETGRLAIDLKDVLLVAPEAVKFLALSEANGIELRNCPAYIREWVARDRTDAGLESSERKTEAREDIEDV